MNDKAATVECVDPDILAAWNAARDAMREPQAALNAIAGIIMRKYGLGPADTIDPATGAIKRVATSPAQ